MKTTGYLLLNKKAGISSFDSLYQVKKVFATGKVCHTGTLDTFAEGLLIVLVGKAVKLASWFSSRDKQYEGIVKLGEETDTLDPEGNISAEAEPCSREAFEAALPRFTGAILQAPPEYSAVHVGGQRAYKLARAGTPPEMKKRPVTVYSLSLVSWDPPFAGIAVHCSTGTYIRSLARDIAIAAGTRAHLSALNRTRVGGFLLRDAVDAETGNLPGTLRPIDRDLFSALSIPVFEIGEKAAGDFSHGKDLKNIVPEAGVAAAPAALAMPPKEGGGAQPCATQGGDFPPIQLQSAAVFGPDGFAGMIVRNGGLWRYGYVNAPDGA